MNVGIVRCCFSGNCKVLCAVSRICTIQKQNNNHLSSFLRIQRQVVPIHHQQQLNSSTHKYRLSVVNCLQFLISRFLLPCLSDTVGVKQCGTNCQGVYISLSGVLVNTVLNLCVCVCVRAFSGWGRGWKNEGKGSIWVSSVCPSVFDSFVCVCSRIWIHLVCYVRGTLVLRFSAIPPPPHISFFKPYWCLIPALITSACWCFC